MSEARRPISRVRKLAIAATALAAAAASALVLSARLWWLGDLVASFEWYVGWLALAAAAVLALLRARRFALAVAALGLVHVAPEASLRWPRSVERAGRSTVRVVAANLLQPNTHRGDLAAALRAQDADVIAVEELSLATRRLLESELGAWPHRVFSPDDTGQWNDGTWALAVFSRLPIASSRLVQLGDSYARSIEAVIDLGDRDLTLRVVHVPRPGRSERIQRRAAALDGLATSFEWTPLCVAVGDFNITSTNPRFARLLDATHLRDSRAGFGRQPTWSLGRLPVSLPIAIDHVLVGDAYDVLARRTFTIPGSDHRGVCAELALR